MATNEWQITKNEAFFLLSNEHLSDFERKIELKNHLKICEAEKIIQKSGNEIIVSSRFRLLITINIQKSLDQIEWRKYQPGYYQESCGIHQLNGTYYYERDSAVTAIENRIDIWPLLGPHVLKVMKKKGITLQL